MAQLKCKTCGGDLALSINSDYAVCENCGNKSDVDFQELGRIRRIYRDAELKTYTNSVDGYQNAISQLQTISFVTEAKEKIALYESRLTEVRELEAKRNADKEKEEKSSSKIGVVILIFFILLLALVVAGIVYVIYHLKAGDLSPVAIGVIAAIAAVTIILMIIGKIKS